MGHTQKKQFIGKEIYKQSSHGRDVSSETYPRSLPHPETSIIYNLLTLPPPFHPPPPPPFARNIIYGWMDGLLSCINKYRCLKNVIHQTDSKNEWLLLSARFTAKFGLVFFLALESENRFL